MADSGHFGFPALLKFPRTLKTGIGAYFVTNTLKYNKKPSNFVSQRLVTKSLILTLLRVRKNEPKLLVWALALNTKHVIRDKVHTFMTDLFFYIQDCNII